MVFSDCSELVNNFPGIRILHDLILGYLVFKYRKNTLFFVTPNTLVLTIGTVVMTCYGLSKATTLSGYPVKMYAEALFLICYNGRC